MRPQGENMADPPNSLSYDQNTVYDWDFTKLLIVVYRDYPEFRHVNSKDYCNKNKKAIAMKNKIVDVLKQCVPDLTSKKRINALRTNFRL